MSGAPPPLRWTWLAKPALSAALAVGVLTAGQAQAFFVKVDGQYWDVSTFDGTYNANKSKFETAANGGVMPWWGSEHLATSFADAVLFSLGFPNALNPGSAIFAPYFAFRPFTASNTLFILSVYRGVGPGGAYFVQGTNQNTGDFTVTWAQATPAVQGTPAVPGPLPILGVAAAFGYSRKLRKRIKNAKSEVISTTQV